MKTTGFFWLLFFLLLLTARAPAQDLAGTWQGVELNPGSAASDYWPTVLTLKTTSGPAVTGELYQVAGSQPDVTGTFAMRGTRTVTGLRLTHVRVLTETNPNGGNWCLGTLVFTYDAALEKLTGRSAYLTPGCHNGTSELYRVRLKSAATVAPAVLSTLRVSGRNVRWFADAALRKPLAAGNNYRTRLRKTTTFYLTQGFYTTDRSPVVPITVRVSPPVPPAPAGAAARVAPPAPQPAPAEPLTAPTPVPAPAPTSAPAGPPPLVLPTVLFRLGTAELLPTAAPALDSLARHLRTRLAVRIRIAGHTDRIGETDKNQLLSEQRAEAVKAYLARAGVDAERMEPVGYGDGRLLYPSPNARNRRVEITELGR